MKLPNQVKSTVRRSTGRIYPGSITETGVHPAACCPGDDNPVCNILGPRVICPPGFTCRTGSICGTEFCTPFGFCMADSFTLGFG